MIPPRSPGTHGTILKAFPDEHFNARALNHQIKIIETSSKERHFDTVYLDIATRKINSVLK
jgi:hypothetical protein